jgi:hypothetical protein
MVGTSIQAHCFNVIAEHRDDIQPVASLSLFQSHAVLLMFINSHISHHFYYADPAIGGGKTHSLKKHLAHPFTGKSIVGIQSIKLAVEIEETLKKDGISVLRVDTDAFPYNTEEPTITCTSIFNDALRSGLYQVLIANYEVVLRAKEPYCREYILFMDEIPPVYERIWLNGIVTSHHDVVSYLTSEKTNIKGYRKVRITDEGERFLAAHHLEKMKRAEKELLDTILKAQNSEYYDLYAEETIYREFREGLSQSVVLHSVMKPAVFDRFARVTILGANYLWSLMNLIWSKHYGVEFALHQQIMTIGEDGIRYQDLKHKAPTTTVYYHSDKNCSKTLYKQVDYQPTFNASHDAFKALLAEKGMSPDTKHLVFLNNKPKGVKGEFYWKDAENAVQLSPAARGWDAYKEIDVAIFLAAVNEHGDTNNFLSAFYSLSKSQIDRATALERAYQAIGRCSLRDRNSNRPVHLIFFEHRAAKFVADLIGCGEPVLIDTGLAGLMAKEPKTGAERTAKAYHKKNVDALADIEHYEGFNRRVWSHQKCFSPKDNFVRNWAKYVFDTYQHSITYRPENKDSAKMYREGDFGSSPDHKIKGVIRSSKMITFDFDNVTGEVQELSNLLESMMISHVISNSYRSRPGAPRFRLDIPLDRPVNASVYRHIADQLLSDIENSFGPGVFVDDRGKRHMHAKFYAPGISEFEGGNIFIDCTVVGQNEEPIFLGVMAYASRPPIEKKKQFTETKANSFAAAGAETKDIEAILDKWAVPEGFETGSLNFHQAGVDLLFKARLSPEEVIQELHNNRYRFGNGDDRDAAYVIGKIMEDKLDALHINRPML